MKRKRLADALLVRPGRRFTLSDVDPADTNPHSSKHAAERTVAANIERLQELQYLLYAENKRAVLVVLQAMDAAGKDGTIRHVMSGLNPQGCSVTSFKVPSPEEAAHDFLWRIHKVVPGHGMIGIFNRSHYEDVLVVRVHGLVPKSVWSKRYAEINAFEQHLAQSNVVILKFFLHVSNGEQKARFQDRLDDPQKNWKVSPADFAERRYWNDYMRAYDDVLNQCSTSWAPWYVIPADKKWFRNLAVSQIIVETLESLDMKFPKATYDPSQIVLE